MEFKEMLNKMLEVALTEGVKHANCKVELDIEGEQVTAHFHKANNMGMVIAVHTIMKEAVRVNDITMDQFYKAVKEFDKITETERMVCESKEQSDVVREIMKQKKEDS